MKQLTCFNWSVAEQGKHISIMEHTFFICYTSKDDFEFKFVLPSFLFRPIFFTERNIGKSGKEVRHERIK